MLDYSAFQPDCVILGAGGYPQNEIPLNILLHARYLCCCDGAALSLTGKGITPQAIVGDGDSLPQTFRERYRDILHIVTEQEDNDLTKATRFCMALGHRSIAYLGATGRREDHTIGNVSLLARYLRVLHLQPMMFTDYGVFIPCEGESTLRTFPRQQVSVFNMTCTEMSSEGLRYPSYATTEWWQGTLNEAYGTEITLRGNGTYIVYLTYEPKTTRPQAE